MDIWVTVRQFLWKFE